MLELERIKNIYVCNMLGAKLYTVQGVQEDTVSLVRKLNGLWEFEFTVTQAKDQTDISYEMLQEGMYLFVETVGYFKMRQPNETIDPAVMTKQVTAYGCAVELEDHNLQIEINMGTKTSQEYLVSQKSETSEALVDPASGIPYDWIPLYNTWPAQLEKFKTWLAAQHFNYDDHKCTIPAVEDENAAGYQQYHDLDVMLQTLPRLQKKCIELSCEYNSVTPATATALFDGKNTTTWSASIANGNASVTCDTGCRRIVKAYSITKASNANRVPTSWTLYGSNDISIIDMPSLDGWVALPTPADMSLTSEVTVFTINNNTAYRYYRLVIGSVASGNDAELAGFSLKFVDPNLMDIVTFEEVTDQESKTTEFAYQHYATYKKNAHDKVVSVTITDKLAERAQELIEYYTEYHDQLSLLDLVCEKMGHNWSVGTVYGVEQGDYELANSHYQFEIDEQIYSFLTATLAEKIKAVVNFDIMHKKINVTPVEHIGEDTGVIMSYNGLLNSLQISTDEDRLSTRLEVHGGNDISIEQVNFGEPYVVDIDYKLGVKNSQGERIYVTDELAEKYARYKTFREEYARPAYVMLTKQYNKLGIDRDELTYRVPRDFLANRWETFKDQELVEQRTNIMNLLHALLNMYGEDYGMPDNTDQSWEVAPSNDAAYPDWMSPGVGMTVGTSIYIPKLAKIQASIYWWDYYAYHQALEQIAVAMAARQAVSDDKGYDYSSLKNEEIKEKIRAWETEWSLYGTVELGAKIKAYEEEMQTMVRGQAVIRKRMPYNQAQNVRVDNVLVFSASSTSESYLSEEDYYHICMILARGAMWDALDDTEQDLFVDATWYNTCQRAQFVNVQWNGQTNQWEPLGYDDNEADIVPWDNLTSIEKSFFGNVEANYYYKEYDKAYQNRLAAKAKKVELEAEIAQMDKECEAITTARQNLTDHVQLSTYQCESCAEIVKPAGVPRDRDQWFTDYNTDCVDQYAPLFTEYEWIAQESFTPTEVKCIHLLYRDAEYTNENILTTSLNNTEDAINHIEELYQDGLEQVSKCSRPQLTFGADAENLFAIPEFEPFWEQFELGNFFYVEYKDGKFVKVRVVEYGYNPFIPSGGMTLQFSTIVRSKAEATDLESVLGNVGSSGISSYGGGGSGGSGNAGEYGDNLNIAISNTMLGKLLGMGSGTTLANSIASFMAEPSTSAVRRISEALRKEVDSFVNAATAAGFALLDKKTAAPPVYRGLKDGDTIVSADCLESGMIRSKDRWAKQKDYATAAAITGLFSTKQSDSNYKSREWYTRVCDVITSVSEADHTVNLDTAWGRLSEAQKALFDTEARFKTLVAADLVYEPNSWFDMNNGLFSYAQGNLTFTPGSDVDNTIGRLTMKGIIEATGGDIGGVKIGSATYDTSARGMHIGAHGMYSLGSDEEFHLRPALASDVTNAPNNVTTQGFAFLKFRRNNPSTDIDNVQTVMSANGLTVQKSTQLSTYYSSLSGGEIRLQGDISLKCANSGADNENSGLPNIPTVVIKHLGTGDGKLECPYIQCDYVSGHTIQGGVTVSGNVSANGTVSGASMSSSGNISVQTNDCYIATATNASGNENTKNRSIKASYAGGYTNHYAALYSNGNIYATDNIRGETVYGGTTRLTGNDYAELFEWSDGDVVSEDRRGRFVTLVNDKIRLSTHEDINIIGIISSTPSVIGNDPFEEWHNKYIKDEFGATLYETVEVPATYDEDGKLLTEAHTEQQPVLNPEYDPDREYIPRSERPEWAVVGLVGQIIMLQDGSCYPNDYCKSADEGIATKSDERTNFRVMKRIDDRHILVMAK